MKLRTKLVIVFMAVMILPMIFMTVAMHTFVPGKADELQQLYLAVVFFTAGLLIYWIYRSVSVPLEKLQKAARNIKEGNLDFEIRQESDDEIGQLCQDFEEMRLRLKANAEEKVEFDRENKELISNISHDLKTPITAIKGYVEGIMDGVADTPEKMDRYIKTIYNKANEMDLLINELTLYSKIDTNRIPYNFATVSARGYFEDCAEDLSMELDAKNVEFSYHNFMEQDCRIIVDPEQLRRVINNIVSNSLKYMDKPRGKITMQIKDVIRRYRLMNKRILIVEDEESIADLEKDYLELSNFEVVVAHDGETGLNKGLNGEFDLIILDLMLPGVDGFEICRQIRSEKNTPIIMVSAKKDDIDKIRGLGLGADDYMTKPFSPSELVARVKAHLARYERLIGSNVEENQIIEIRGLKIDTTARRVWVNGEEKSFTTKEFDLLTFLAGHPNHVYTKEELFREIWDMESIGDIATVTVHIKKIREKIEYDTSHPQYIETIWGVGYRFKV